MGAAGAGSDIFSRNWRWWVLLFWLVAAALLVYDKWNFIDWFALGDTDDNLRLMQVRALLGGQDWYDLRQYRLDPPAGADVHWSRLVDLPLAGIILFLRLFMTGAMAEKVAVAVAPMLPMALAMGSVALVARRLVAPKAFTVAVALLLCAPSARGMWAPLRLDHHGWQLAMLSLVMVALADRKPARGGLILGLATAVSLSIGLELLIYLAVAGAVTALTWVRDPAQAPRLAAYGASLAGGCAAGFALFASEANRAPVCDALSPVWLSAMVGAGAIAVALALLAPGAWLRRLLAGAAAAAALAAAFAWAWPHCLGRLEGVSPELERMWLGNVREARPIYTHQWQVMVSVLSLPLAGLAGYATTLWRVRTDQAALTRWAGLALLALTAAALLLWQSRAGPAAQLLAVPGATALVWRIAAKAFGLRNVPVAVVAVVAGFLIVSGVALQSAARLFPQPASARIQRVNAANGRCPTLAALRPVARLPRGYVLTFVDLGPRLIAVTHHDAVAGPYHRNQAAILDVMRTFRGSADHARGVVERRGIDYVLICPNLSESTVYRAEAPKGLYMQLARGEAPDWLQPVPLPKDSPYKMWRVRR